MTAANHDLEARPLTDEDCGFCGLHLGLHPRFKTIDALNKAQERDADAHEWVHRGTVAAVRADERRASEERERVLREALAEVSRTQLSLWEAVQSAHIRSLAHDAAMNTVRRALLNPEDAGDKEGGA